MKRTEFERAVYESDLDPQSKQILAYYGYVKNWNEDGKVWTSGPTVARHTGLSEKTIKRRMPLLREYGWLVDTGQRIGNGAIVYDLAIGTSVTQTLVRILDEANQGQTDPSSDTTENNQGHSDPTTRVSESLTRVSESLTRVCESPKQVRNKKEQVREQVTTGAGAPVEVKEIHSKDESPLCITETSNPSLVIEKTHAQRVFEESPLLYGEKVRLRDALQDTFAKGEDPQLINKAWTLMFDTGWEWNEHSDEIDRAWAVREEVGLPGLW